MSLFLLCVSFVSLALFLHTWCVILFALCVRGRDCYTFFLSLRSNTTAKWARVMMIQMHFESTESKDALITFRWIRGGEGESEVSCIQFASVLWWERVNWCLFFTQSGPKAVASIECTMKLGRELKMREQGGKVWSDECITEKRRGNKKKGTSVWLAREAKKHPCEWEIFCRVEKYSLFSYARVTSLEGKMDEAAMKVKEGEQLWMHRCPGDAVRDKVTQSKASQV